MHGYIFLERQLECPVFFQKYNFQNCPLATPLKCTCTSLTLCIISLMMVSEGNIKYHMGFAINFQTWLKEGGCQKILNHLKVTLFKHTQVLQ